MINGYRYRTSHRAPSFWREKIHQLAEKLQSFRDLPACEEREKLREDFYESFRNLSAVASRKLIHEWEWKGDRFHDSEDIVSACTSILLRQEVQCKGPFNSAKVAAGCQLRGYLSRLVWRGAAQRTANLYREQVRCRKGDESPLDMASRPEDAVSFWQDVQTLRERLLTGLPGKYRTPAGQIPLDGVLDKALADAGERKLHEETGVPKRTWQRLEQEARDLLRQRLRHSEIWTRDRKAARRKVTLHLDSGL